VYFGGVFLSYILKLQASKYTNRSLPIPMFIYLFIYLRAMQKEG